jgi:hypothetical protein
VAFGIDTAEGMVGDMVAGGGRKGRGC